MAEMRRLLAVCVCVFVVSRIVSAQVSGTTGQIVGTVTDATQGVVPGATVTLSGSSVMGTPTFVTDSSGLYRFQGLAPGDYSLHFELPGFGEAVRERIRVAVGFTATVDVELAPAGLQESVTVSGGSPVVDLQSTTVATHFDAERLVSLPGSRDVWAVLAQAPAVAMTRMDVGGSNALTQQAYTSYGLNSAGGVNRAEVEGLMVNEGAGGGGSDMYYTDYGSFSEIAVNAVGNTAQMPTPGVLTQLVSKSGGNTYHGNIYADYENDRMETHNIDASQVAAGVTGSSALAANDVNRLSAFHDFNGDLGGFVVKDKLWWYGAYRYSAVSQRYPTLLDDIQDTSVWVGTTKVSYNVNARHHFTGYVQTYEKDQPDYLGAIRITGGRNSTALMRENTVWASLSAQLIWKGEYNATIGRNLFLEARGGQWSQDWNRSSKDSGQRVEDVGNNQVSGGVYGIHVFRYRRQGNGAVSYTGALLGTHSLKVGGEIMNDNLRQQFGGFPSGFNSVSVLNNGVPTQVDLYRSPNESQNGLWTYGVYVADTWQPTRRLTLNVGLRFDRHRAYVPAQTGPAGQGFPELAEAAKFHNLGPRAGATYAITSDAKTVAKISYGKYWLYPASDFATNLNPNPAQWIQTYAWSDLNLNRVWDEGEQGRLASFTGGVASATLDPHLQNSYVSQVTTYLEREVLPDFGIRSGFVWNGRRQVYGQTNVNRPLSAYAVSVPVVDPGPDGRVGTSDDGQLLTAYALTPEALALPIVNITTNLDGADSDYYTWELTATRRKVGRLALLTSFAKTWSSETALSAGAGYTPAALINTEGGRNKFDTWQAKVQGTIDAPWQLRISPIARLQSGTPFARTFTQSLNFGTATIKAEPFGAERTPNIAVFDLRTEKALSIRTGLRATVFADVYNIFNTNAEQQLTTASGATFLRPAAITAPRIARIGARLEW